MAASENHTVRLPRWRKLASYSRQFITFRFCLGMWWRRSWFSLNGKMDTRGIRAGPILLRLPCQQRHWPDPCNSAACAAQLPTLSASWFTPLGNTSRNEMRVLAIGTAVALFNAGALAQSQPPAQSSPATQRERHSMPEGTSVYIIYPRSGATLRPGPVRVRFGLSEKAGVAPAGIARANTGHHHLFIDNDIPQDLSQEIPPTNPHLMHFGLGQTEVTIN